MPGGLMYRWAEGRTPERLEASWPYSSLSPQRLACDAAGQHLLVTDGLSMFEADLRHRGADFAAGAASHSERSTTLRGSLATDPEEPESVAFTATADCAGLLGESLQDATLLCDAEESRGCEAVVLHNRGRQITSCPL